MKNKFKRLLAVLLSLICILSTTPITAYASTTYNLDKSDIFFGIGKKGDINTYLGEYSEGTLPKKAENSTEMLKSNKYFLELFTTTCTYSKDTYIEKGEYLTFKITAYANSRYISFPKASVTFNWGGLSDFKEGYANPDNVSYNHSDGTIEFTVVCPVKTRLCDIFVRFDDITINQDYSNSYFRLTSYKIIVSDQNEANQKNFFSNIAEWFSKLFQWLKDIRDNLSNGFSNIGTWLTGLGDRISNYFNNLGKDIKTWFDNLVKDLKNLNAQIGQWFTDITNSIGQFFTNLWNDITSSIDSITVSVRSWWQSVVDFFHSLFVPEDGFFDEYRTKWDEWLAAHFGFLYESVHFIDDIFSTLEVLGSGLRKPYITIPQLKLPWNNMVILQSQRWNLDELTQSHSQLIWVFDTIKLFVSALMFFALLLYGKKTFSELLGMEGE